MVRVAGALVVGLTLAVLSNARAADVPTGTYKIVLPYIASGKALWLLKLSEKDGKPVGEITASDEGVPPGTTVESVSAKDGLLRFTLKMPRVGDLKVEAKLSSEKGAKILGNATLRDQVMPASLEPTSLASLDPYLVNKEALAKLTPGPEALQASLILLSDAEDKKATTDEVTAWADKALKSAEPYGDKLVRDTLIKIAEPLSKKETYAKIALPYAMREKMLTKDDTIGVQKKVLGVLATIYEKAGKPDEAKAVRARDAKLSYVIATPYPGRKAKSDRVVLVELFTGAQCPPCVAADIAFDGLGKTYKDSDVVLLQYHLHIPGPDPLTNPDTESRQKFYGRSVRGTPSIFFNGKSAAGGGGSFEQGQEKYKEFTAVIDPLLEKPAKGKIKLTATRKGDKIEIKADVSALEETGDDVRLRLVLVEKEIAYQGGNKLPTHHHVVRSFPGGTAGTAMKEKSGSKNATVDVSELKKKLKDYLVKANEEDPFPSKEWPLNFKNLSVVAFVQNDDTQEVLQAVQVPVKVDE